MQRTTNEAIRLAPEMTDAYNNRGIAWRVQGNTERGIADFILASSGGPKVRYGKRALAQKACELTAWRNAHHVNTLAAAHAETGDLARPARERLELYRAGKPLPSRKSEGGSRK